MHINRIYGISMKEKPLVIRFDADDAILLTQAAKAERRSRASLIRQAAVAYATDVLRKRGIPFPASAEPEEEKANVSPPPPNEEDHQS